MRNFYIRLLFITGFLYATSAVYAQNVAINTSGNSAYASSILDLSNSNTSGQVGFLPPYVTLTSIGTFGMLGNPAQSNGLIVYNTGGAVPAGLYYWNNTATCWVLTGGVNSITGTAPIVVTPTTGSPVVSLQGTAGGIFYGTGGGSNVTGAGTSGQYLMSNGAAAPSWQTIYSTAGQTHVNYSSAFSQTTNGSEFSSSSTAYVNVTGASLTLTVSGTYLIIATAEFLNTHTTFGGELTLSDGTNNWGTSAFYESSAYWAGWSTQAVVTIASSTTYNIQMASWTGTVSWVRNATVTAIKVN
jgi:hypothetical protein